MTTTVLVKFGASSSCPVEIHRDATVKDLKDAVAATTGLAVDNLQLILAGRILNDESSLKTLSLGNCTVVHAFQQQRPLQVNAQVGLNQLSSGSSQTEKRNLAKDERMSLKTCPPLSETPSPFYQFYVFCKQCGALQPGKLRVVCGNCNEGSIILSREPAGFDDVLLPGRILGECKNSSCGSQQEANFFFKCAVGHDRHSDNCLVLRHIKPNRRHIECITCTDVRNPVLVYPCLRKHVICIECFTSYCVVNLNERGFVEDPESGYSLPCPGGCPNSLIKETHHFYLLGNEQYERYKNFAAEEYVLQNDGILCPAPRCGSGFLLDRTSRKVICPACRYEFCIECRSAFHIEEECTQQIFEDPEQNINIDIDQELRARYELESMETIEKISKSCPRCSVKTERSGGCMHMTCSLCKADWCWICEKEWTRDCQGNHWFG